MVDALGELDDDELVNFVLQHVRDKSRPEVIVEGLEPVSCTLAPRNRKGS